MTSNHEMIGRHDLDDLEAILSITNHDVDELQHIIHADSKTLFTWDYEQSRAATHQALREGEDVAVERLHRPRLVDRASTRKRWSSPTPR